MNPIAKPAFAALVLSLGAAAQAQMLPGLHPRYLHAMSDLRAAQWQVDHRRPEDGEVREDELVISDEIAAASQSIRKAAVTDEKDLSFVPPTDAPTGFDGRLHAAIDLLRRARADVGLQEDDPNARGQQRLAMLHLDAALHACERAINAVRRSE